MNCSIQNVVDNCPQACRLCCDDDADFKYETFSGIFRQCKWLSQNEKRQKKYCGKKGGEKGAITVTRTTDVKIRKKGGKKGEALIENKCGISCGRCDSPSSMPSYSSSPSYSYMPSTNPSVYPVSQPSGMPSSVPSSQHSSTPSSRPSSTPSRFLSLLPSSEPSMSMEPTSEPSSKPSISSQPSLIPSLFPSSDPTQSCRDNPAFRRNNVEKKSCDWIGSTEDRRSMNCSIQNVVDNCPQACRVCCGDDEDFRLETDRGVALQCKWLSRKVIRRQRYCERKQNGALVTNKCGESCGRC